MLLVMPFGVVFSSGLCVLIGQIVVAVSLISLVGFFFVFTCFVQLLSFLVMFGRFPKVISCFFVMFVCHVIGRVLMFVVLT